MAGYISGIFQKLDLPFDERCRGCPAIIASENNLSELAELACDNRYLAACSDDLAEVGCKKGKPIMDVLVTVGFVE